MRIKKTVWIFSMTMLVSLLFLIVNSRVQLVSTVIFPGADEVFVESDGLKDPLADYEMSEDEEEELDLDTLEFPDVLITDWNFLLVNDKNHIDSYAPQLKKMANYSVYVDERIVEYADALLAAAEEAGFDPYISLGYRSFDNQTYVFTTKASQLVNENDYTYDEAVALTKKMIQYPGASEHQSGLAIDIIDTYRTSLDYEDMDDDFYEWLDAHCAEYGFIKRYPADLEKKTDWNEPYHYRYVGKEAAEFIMEYHISFEEFVKHYESVI